MDQKQRVGLFGAPAVCTLMQECALQGKISQWDFIDINPPATGKPPANNPGILKLIYMKLRDLLYLFRHSRSIDILCIVFVDNWSGLFLKIAKMRGIKVVYYWLGTDVYNLLQGTMPKITQKSFSGVDLHIAYGENLIEELAPFGVEAHLQVTPPDLPVRCAKMPAQHAVLLSIPDARPEFYGYSTLMEVVKKFPEVPFYIVRSDTPDLYQESNIVFKGVLSREEMDKLYDCISIVIRYPKHDGTSLLLMESLLKGKQIISRFSFPFACKVESFQGICDALENMLRNPAVPNYEWHNWALKNFNQAEAGRKLSAYLQQI